MSNRPHPEPTGRAQAANPDHPEDETGLSSSAEDEGRAGTYMCHYPEGAPEETVDHPSPADLKQEAVVAVLAARSGREDVVCTECERLVEEDAGLAWAAYARARVDHYRARREMRGSRRQIAVEDIAEPEETDQRKPVTSKAIVRRMVRERVPELTDHQIQRVVIEMSAAQSIKRRPGKVMPAKLRAALARLRKSTGLPLDTSLL